MPSPEAVFQLLRQKIQEDYRSDEQFARCGNGTDGIGVTQNYAEALRWYRKAADAGDAD
jgi:TPR repeat protein